MLVLAPDREASTIVGSYQYKEGAGVVRNDSEYNLSEEAAGRFVEEMTMVGSDPKLARYLERYASSKSRHDQIAAELFVDADLRHELALKMIESLRGWGGYIPVVDRDEKETIIVGVESEAHGGLEWYLLGYKDRMGHMDWFKQEGIWPLVFWKSFLEEPMPRTDHDIDYE